MKYEFPLEEYGNIIDTIYEREDVETYGFRRIKIAEEEGIELYVEGYRIVIPELNMTVRTGMIYEEADDGEEAPADTYVLYDGDEKDPQKFTESYGNTSLPSLIGMIARDRKCNTNPMCFIDDSEFDLWTDW